METAAVVPTVEEEKPHHERVRHVFRGSVLAAKTLQPVEGARVALLGPDSRAPADCKHHYSLAKIECLSSRDCSGWFYAGATQTNPESSQLSAFVRDLLPLA